MSSFGRLLRVSTFGESHCQAVGVVIDGVPPRMSLTEKDIQPQLTRRRPGQSKLTTPRNEADKVSILSGTEFGLTLGTPIAMMVRNKDHRPRDYGDMADIPRPSHADFTYQMKYGLRASSGGGRSSARETIGRVAAGAIADKWLKERYGTEIVAWVSGVHTISAPRSLETQNVTREQVDQNIVRCPDSKVAEQMSTLISDASDNKDSLGGVVTCVCRNVPVGSGEPCFDKLEALLAHAMLSIPATKGFEIGSGFEGCSKFKGSEHNDPFTTREQSSDPAFLTCAGQEVSLKTLTNKSGGIQGGISNGEDIVFRIAFKPPATIGQRQKTASFEGEDCELAAKGRHDPCVLPRAVPIVEAMAALVIADAAMVQESRVAAASNYGQLGKVNAKDAARLSAL